MKLLIILAIYVAIAQAKKNDMDFIRSLGVCEVNNPCRNQGICSSIDGITAQCQCTEFFMGVKCEKVAPNFGRGMLMAPSVDTMGRMVSRGAPCHPDPCLNEGVCTDTGSSYQCACPWGYVGGNCEICITDCASNPCSANQKCRAKYGGGFTCVCAADRFGANCELQNDLCATNPCINGGVCHPTENASFKCECSQPWTGDKCEQIWENPCTSEALRSTEVVQFPNPWDTKGYLICTDLNKFHEMPCSVGTEYNAKNMRCVPFGYVEPHCPIDHCQNLGTCIVDADDKLACVCRDGFAGDFCEINIDNCKGHDNCQSGQCIDQVNGYYCQCPGGGIGLNCKQTIQSPCSAANLKKGLEYFFFPTVTGDSYIHCIDKDNWLIQRCVTGLFWNSDANTCTPDASVALTGKCIDLPCHHNGECVDLGSSKYQCKCRKGYTGEDCETMINYCDSNPCLNGGKCLAYSGGFTCMCPDNIVDDCCCHGIENPCPKKDFLIPGVNNYFEHIFPAKYFHCDFNGKAFVRNCALGTKWFQKFLTCRSPELFETIPDVTFGGPTGLIPQQSTSPHQTFANQQTFTNQQTPQQTVAPQQTLTPQQTFIPQQTLTPTYSSSYQISAEPIQAKTNFEGSIMPPKPVLRKNVPVTSDFEPFKMTFNFPEPIAREELKTVSSYSQPQMLRYNSYNPYNSYNSYNSNGFRYQ